MSPGERIRWTAAVASARLPATCYRLAAHLAEAAKDGTGRAWPSRGNLARSIGCDAARLTTAFRALEAAGFLVRGELDGPRGRQTYRWRLVLPGAGVAPPAEVAPGADLAPSGGAEVAKNPLRKSPPKRGREEGREEGGASRFAPPSVDEVTAYCEERRNGIDPQRFLDYYTANGWRMGKTPVRDWRACVRTWEARNRERTPVADPAGLTFTERAVTADEIRSMMNLPAQGLACG